VRFFFACRSVTAAQGARIIMPISTSAGIDPAARAARRVVRSEELIDNILVYLFALCPCSIWRWVRGATIGPAFDRPSFALGRLPFRSLAQ